MFHFLSSNRTITRRKIEYNIRNILLISCAFLIVLFLIIHHQSRTKSDNDNKSNDKPNIDSIIYRIRDIPILDQHLTFNVTHVVKVTDALTWLEHFGITHLFDFRWLQTGAYVWHLKRMIDLKHTTVVDIPTQKFHSRWFQNDLYGYLNRHPEYGVIIDTAPDPFLPLFLPLPRTSKSLHETCTSLHLSETKFSSSFSISSPLFTFALYDTTIDLCSNEKCTQSSRETVHYDELIYVFDSQNSTNDETLSVTQILPRLIRLLALVPQTALVLVPPIQSIPFLNQYVNVLIELGLLKNRKQLLEYDPKKLYHANAIYSTISPRFDLSLVQHILTKNNVKRDLILIVRNHIDQANYDELLQAVNQMEPEENVSYLQVYEYMSEKYDLKNVSQIFQRARIVIGKHGHMLTNIIWCLAGTHIIEIGQKNMTLDYFTMSIQLNLNYWLGITNEYGQVDMIDFRNLLIQIFAEI